MVTRRLCATALAFVLFGVSSEAVGQTLRKLPHRERVARRQAQYCPWHGNYAQVEWGGPVALVVPPQATFQTNWGWGVGNTRVSRTVHQFARPYPVPFADSPGFRRTPPWPSDTNQFGVYYVRGPW